MLALAACGNSASVTWIFGGLASRRARLVGCFSRSLTTPPEHCIPCRVVPGDSRPWVIPSTPGPGASTEQTSQYGGWEASPGCQAGSRSRAGMLAVAVA